MVSVVVFRMDFVVIWVWFCVKLFVVGEFWFLDWIELFSVYLLLLMLFKKFEKFFVFFIFYWDGWIVEVLLIEEC